MREKWASLVSHIANERLDANVMPRKMTIYMAAPPGDGLRIAREHFHNYIKPVLVAAAMDWDVIEGRKEGDVRFKTAERVRKKRKRAGEGEPVPQEEVEGIISVDAMREKNGTRDWDGIAGDLVVGRNTWKEYVRGLHEGWLGPVDPPKQPETDAPSGEKEDSTAAPGHSSLGDAAVKAAVKVAAPPVSESSAGAEQSKEQVVQGIDDASPTADLPLDDGQSKDKKEEDEKPKPRHPPPYIQLDEYTAATPSTHIPEVIGPSAGVRIPHILGFRNTPIRIYRFLTRRHLADSIGRDVAAAVLASYRPYSTTVASNDDGASSDSPEQNKVLQHEERDWWKTTFRPREEHEESVWIEDMVLDERIASRMRAFQLTAEDEDRAKRIAEGKEKVVRLENEEG